VLLGITVGGTARGNVGIGTTGPGAKLHVSGGGTGVTTAKFGDGTLGQRAIVDIIAGSDTNAFQVWDDNDLVTPKFIVKRAGNVGIGTPSPGAKLEVVGGVTKTTGGLVIETRTTDPTSPEVGRLWLRTDL